ncbi:hypothetical protein EWI07_07370 [Sporolactobacillus sp. THM7-4]|nr:hypothetical protein EWI07_07370 [Sporolactobacillus sp. THM7-4]
MKSNQVDVKHHVLLGTSFLIIAIILFAISIHGKIVFLLPLSLIIGISSISIYTRPLKNYRIIKVYDIFASWVLGIIYFIVTIGLSFALISLSVILVWGLLNVALKGIIILLQHYDVLRSDHIKYESSVIYISSLVAAVSMSYFGNKIIYLIDKILGYSAVNKTETARKISIVILTRLNLRKRVYELSIILYILSVIDTLSNTTIINNVLWNTYKPIALEVMLTFVAVDTYLMTFFQNKS